MIEMGSRHETIKIVRKGDSPLDGAISSASPSQKHLIKWGFLAY